MKFQSQRGAALVVTLIVLTALAVVAVAMLTNTSLDRMTVASSANIYRAQLAADAGIEAAVAQISNILGNDDRAVTLVADDQGSAVYNPNDRKPFYTWIAAAENGQPEPQAKYVPLVSGGANNLNLRNLDEIPGIDEMFDESYADLEDLNLNLPRALLDEFGDSQPSAKPVTLTDQDGNVVARYAYWVEDLQGKIDVSVSGGPAPGDPLQSRAQIPNSNQDIGLFTLFDKNALTNPGNTLADQLISNREAFLTTETIKFVAPEIISSFSASSEIGLHLHPGLGFETDAPEIIPYGFNFQNAGQPKVALNSLMEGDPANAVQNIAGAISTNMPDFAPSRAGGMVPQNYLNNLAANIIDYADADQNPTTNGTYRGFDSFPLVCQWMVMTWYSNRNPAAPSATFIVWNFIEVWNMTDQTVQGSLSFSGINGYQPVVGGTLLDFANPGAGVAVTPSPINTIAVNLAPNEKRVLDFGQTIYTVASAAIPPATIPLNQTWNFDYSLNWQSNGQTFLIDKSGGKAYGVNKNLNLVAGGTPTTNVAWNAFIPGLIYKAANNNAAFLNGNVGDPRASFYINVPQDANNYQQNVGIGGLLVRQGIGQDKSYYGVLPENWPDPSPQPTGLGTLVGTNAKIPTDPTIAPAPTGSDRAISKLANYADSKYRSITELGHIFDPGQWQLYSGTEMSEAQEAWKDIGQNAIPDSRFGGGYTLRIGRPEFTRFDSDGKRAGELLSIFSINPTKSTRGLININTASYDSLRTMAAGIRMEEGSFKQPNAIFGPTDSEQADRFAKAVIQSRPFFATHQLATNLSLSPLDGNDNFFWGNPGQWSAGERPVKWRDGAAEDYFRKVYDLATVSSRNFRIYSVGQTLNPITGKVLSQAYKTRDVYFEAIRDETDPTTINSFRPIRLYEKNN